MTFDTRLLCNRSIHSEVLRFCRAELVDENYFHAVFEATKSIAERIRELSGLSGDGSVLIEQAFNLKHPLLAINGLSTEVEESEQTGYQNLLKGIFGMFRNTTAHAPKIKWKVTEEEAIELLTLVSFAHRKLDRAVRTYNN